MVTSASEEHTIFDSDFHLTETFSQIVEYLDDPYKSIYKRDSANIGSRTPFPDPGWFSPDIMGKHSIKQNLSKEHVIDAMEEYNLDCILIQPSMSLHLGMVHHDELATAVANAYNEWVLDKIIDVDRGIYGSILVAPQRPKDAAAEINDRKSERGFVSTLIPSGGLHPPLGNRRYHPIYEASEHAGLPVILHNAVSSILTGFPVHFQGFTRELTCHATLHPMQHMSHLSDMIVQGIPVRYPDLQIVIQEGGVGWIPFMMRRLDNEYLNHRSDAPMLEEMPSDYIRRQFYFTTQPFEGQQEPDYVKYMIDLIGVDNILFSTDYPHFDFDNTEAIMNRLSQLPPEDQKNIMGSTAMDLFNINHEI
jgi:predicted TIM-barrel fold metal-dependent hydrolase